MLVFLLVPAAFVGLLGFGLFTAQAPKAVAGSPAPHFELPLIDGGTLSSRDLIGSPVVVNFWASWCPPCREEAPNLERAWIRYRDQGVWVIGVNIQDLTEDAADFVGEFGITFPVVRDADQDVARAFGVTGLPETYFIDEEWKFFAVGRGREVGRRGPTVIRGAISSSLLHGHIRVMLGGATPP